MITLLEEGDRRLPIESQALDRLQILEPNSVLHIPVTLLSSDKVGGYGRSAQAICLLDQVFRSFHTVDIDLRFLQLGSLDSSLQALLSAVMPHCDEVTGVLCPAIAIIMR